MDFQFFNGQIVLVGKSDNSTVRRPAVIVGISDKNATSGKVLKVVPLTTVRAIGSEGETVCLGAEEAFKGGLLHGVVVDCSVVSTIESIKVVGIVGRLSEGTFKKILDKL